MPFGIGPAGWYAWPHVFHWMRFCDLWHTAPYWAPFQRLTKEEEESFLKDQVNMLEERLAQIKKRLEELKKQDKEEK